MSYAEDIARWRAQRQQQEVEARLEEVRREYAEAEALRDQALREQNAGDAALYDNRVMELENEYSTLVPDQQHPAQQIPGVEQFATRYRNFFDKYGQKALQVCALADTYATRPRNPNSTQDQNAGMGLRRGSAEYWKAVPTLLEMYGGQFGCPFDPSDAALSPDEAAALSGVDNDTYNENVRKMWDSGHNSDALFGAWDRKVG